MVRFLLPLFVLVSAVLGGAVPQARAHPIAFSFVGIIVSAEPDFPSVHPGQPVFGLYTFESTTPDSDPNPARGLYLSPGTFSAIVGPVVFSFPLSFIEVLNNFGGTPDRYTVAAQSGNTLLELTLFDAANQNPFSTDSLPLVPPPLSQFDDSKQFQVFLRTPPDLDFVSKIDANVVAFLPALPVSAPATLLLLLAGCALSCAVSCATRLQNLE